MDLLADSDKFPSTWMFDHRWGKGSKAGSLPDGEKLAWITVGGRTSCYAPEIQKKTGHVAPGVKEEPLEDGDVEDKPKEGKTKRAKVSNSKIKDLEAKKGKSNKSKAEDVDADGVALEKKTPKRSKLEDVEETKSRKRAKVKQDAPSKQKITKTKSAKKKTNTTAGVEDPGRRRSARLSSGAQA